MGLLIILKNIKPEIILEIGTAKGGTLFLLSRVVSPTATIISIDLPGGPFGGGYEEWRIPLYHSFSRDQQKIHLLRADSHDPETIRKVEKIIGNRKIDFIFIDGDHTYEGVKKDFEKYSLFIRDSGMIAFHDIQENSHVLNFHVHRFWEEIKNQYDYTELICKEEKSDRICGIGIIHSGARRIL